MGLPCLDCFLCGTLQHTFLKPLLFPPQESGSTHLSKSHRFSTIAILILSKKSVSSSVGYQLA